MDVDDVREEPAAPGRRAGRWRWPGRRGAALVVVLVIGTTAACGCSGDGSGETGEGRREGGATTTSPSGSPDGSGAAAAARGAEPTCEDGSLQDRAFVLCTAGDRRNQRLVVALHGRGSTAQEMQAATQLEHAAADEGLAVVYPDSRDGGWGDDTFTTPSRPTGDEDVTFLDDLVAELRRDPRIHDRRRVGVVGFSNGASMALRYASQRPEAVRAVVSVAGQLPRDPAIRPSQPVPLLEVYGTADPVRSYDAGIPDDPDRRPGDPTPTLPTAETVAAFVAPVEGASYEGPHEADPDPSDGTRLRTERWLGAHGAVVVLQSVMDGGHTWPSSRTPPRPDFGRVSRDLDASAEAIAFVLHPRSVGQAPPDESADLTASEAPPALPSGASERLRAALDALTAHQRADTAAVRAAVVAALPGTASPRLAVDRGITGIAVPDGDSCVMARLVDPVEAWYPPDVYLEPGEYGCDPVVAAAGLAQRPPH